MRILQVISSAGFYGAENVVVNLAAGLSRLGHDVTVVGISNSHNRHLEVLQASSRLGVKTQAITSDGRFDANAFRSLRRLATSVRADVLHSHGYKSDVLVKFASRNDRWSTVATCHNWLVDTFALRIYAHVDRWALKSFDKVVALSSPIKEKLLAAGINPSRIEEIANGVDVARFDIPREQARKQLQWNSEFVFCVLTRLDQAKGVQYLLPALASARKKVVNARLVIAGDGDYRSTLERQARELRIADHVDFLGLVPDVAPLLRAADAFVLPSLEEAMPMTILEAMAAETPVIATDVGSVSKLLSNDRLGFLVPAGDSEQLSAAMQWVFEHKEEALQRAHGAHACVRAHYSTERMAQQYAAMYEKIAPASGRSA